MNIYKKILRPLFYPISMIYLIVIFFRNHLYNIKLFPVYKLPTKVISVGNITVGGTGKTPIIITLAKILSKSGFKVSVLSRGYLRKTKGTLLVSNGEKPLCEWKDCGDEAYMLSHKLTNIPIVVDENRYRGGTYLTKHFKPDIILLDDAFQHRKLYRDFDLIIIDSNDTLKKHKLLPLGILREPWNNIARRADSLFITKGKPNDYLKKKLKSTSIPLFNIKTIPSLSKNYSNTENKIPLNQGVLLLSGIGNNSFFKKTASYLGLYILQHEKYKDHFLFTKKDIITIENKAERVGAKYIVTTEKDWVRIKQLKPKFSYAIIEIDMKIEKEKKFISYLNKKLNLRHSPSKNNSNKS